MATFILPMGAKWRVDAVGPVQEAADAVGIAMTMFYHADYGWNGMNSLSPKWLDKVFVRRVAETPGAVTWLPTNYFT